MAEQLVKIILCHLVGDYVLQSDFIAQTKGKNWYHLFVHCALYIVPFYIVFGFDERLWCIFLAHLWIDPLKARHNQLPYWLDQVLHYLFGLVYVLFIK